MLRDRSCCSGQNVSAVQQFRELNHQGFTMANLNENSVPLVRLPQIKPKTNRRNYKSRPFNNQASCESNKENFPTSNLPSSSKDNCVAVKVHGLRNRSSNDLHSHNKTSPLFGRKSSSDKSDGGMWSSTEWASTTKMSAEKYDENRNLTILFFLEILTDKGQPRTIEDLSCQLGGKGFTKEMRQIAGGSQAGLKNFFSQYPSLFTIDGEYVTITCYNSGSAGNGSLNGSKSAATSSSDVANSIGSSSTKRNSSIEAMSYFRNKLEQYGAAEVPLRSLLGHRSQATPDIRQISGQNLNEFKDFLCKYPDTFVIHNDFVILRKHWDAVCKNGISPEGAFDGDNPPDWQLIACCLNLCHDIIIHQGPTSVDNLYNKLCLKLKLQSPEFEVQFVQIVKNAHDLETLLKDHSDRFLVQNGVVYLVPPKSTSNSTGTVSTSTPAAVSHSEPLVINSPTLVLTTSHNSVMSINQNPHSPSQTTTVKQRLETQRGRAVLADREPLDQHIDYRTSSVAGGFLKESSNGSSAHLDGQDIESRHELTLKSIKIITTVKECQALVTRLRMVPVISFAAEGVNLGPMGPMTLLQIGTANGLVYILDMQTCKELLVASGMKEILESPEIKKVVHDCRNSSAALYYQFGITFANVFDTQAAHAVILAKTTKKPEHKIKNISLNKLRRMFGPRSINMAKKQMSKSRRDQKFWNRRPFSEEMLLEAADEIFALVPTVYETMNSLIRDDRTIQLFNQLNWEQINYYVKVDDVRLKKKQRKIEFEVEELKTKLSQMSGHVVLSNREIRLLRFVNMNDHERAKLENSHKVSHKLQRLQLGENGHSLEISSGHSDVDSLEMSDDDCHTFKKIDQLTGGRYESDNMSVVMSENGGCPLSPRSSMSPSFEETIRIVEEFLANDRLERLRQNNDGDDRVVMPIDDECHCSCRRGANIEKASVACQTTSTADIVITKVYFEDLEDRNV